jgi:hypothetical protein
MFTSCLSHIDIITYDLRHDPSAYDDDDDASMTAPCIHVWHKPLATCVHYRIHDLVYQSVSRYVPLS